MEGKHGKKIQINFIQRISWGANAVGLFTLGLMAILVVAGIIMRYFFLRPLPVSYEVLQLMMIIPVATGLAYTALRKGHLHVDLLKSRFSFRNQAVIDLIINLLSLGMFALITWGFLLEAESSRFDQMLKIPVFPFLYVFAAGSAILCLVFIYNAIEQLEKVVSSSDRPALAGSLFLVILILVIFSGLLMGQGWLAESNRELVGVLGIILLLVLLILGMPAAVALALTGFLGSGCLKGIGPGLAVLRDIPLEAVASYTFIALPLFLLMTAFIQQSGIAQSVYLAAIRSFGHLPGGYALGGIAASALNAAVSFSGQSNAAAAGSVALLRMKKDHPDSARTKGGIAAGTAITLLIPPGLGLMVYALLSKLSIIKIFLAGLIPGILLSAFFLLYTYFAGRSGLKAASSLPGPAEKRSLSGFILLLPAGIWLIPLFGLYAGIFTPTEAAAAGALAAFIMAASWTPVWGRSIVSVAGRSLLQALHTTCMVGLLLVGAAIFSHFIALTALPVALANFAAGLNWPSAIVLFFICLVYILLGYFLEPLFVIVFSLPVLFPVVTALGYDPIWFGAILMLLIGLGMLLSPYRLNRCLAAIHGKGILNKKVPAGVLPFAVLTTVLLILLIAFPQIVLWLPGLLW